MGATTAGFAFPDHHRHEPSGMARIFEQAVRERAHAIVATEKDEQSLLELALPHTTVPLWIARTAPALTGEAADEIRQALREGFAILR